MRKIKVIVYGFFDNGYDNWVMYVKDELLVKVKKCIYDFFFLFLVFFCYVIVFLYLIDFFNLILG